MNPQAVYVRQRICQRHFAKKYLTWNNRLMRTAYPELCLPGDEGKISLHLQLLEYNQIWSFHYNFVFTQLESLPANESTPPTTNILLDTDTSTSVPLPSTSSTKCEYHLLIVKVTNTSCNFEILVWKSHSSAKGKNKEKYINIYEFINKNGQLFYVAFGLIIIMKIFQYFKEIKKILWL